VAPHRLISAARTTWDLLWAQRLGRLSVALLAALAAVYLFEIGSESWRGALTGHLDRVVLPLMIALLVARTRSVERGEERRFWRLITAALAVWFLGTAVFFASYTAGLPRWVDLAVDVCYVLLYLLLFLASDQQPQLASGWSKGDVLYRYSIAGAVVFIAIMFSYFVVVPWAVEPSENAQYAASFNLYVTLDTLLAVKFGLLTLAAGSPRWRRCFALIALAVAVLAVGDLIEGLTFAGVMVSVTGSRIDTVWLFPHFFLAVMILTCTGPVGARDVATKGMLPRIQSLLPFYALSLPLVHFGLNVFGTVDADARAAREVIVFFGLLVFAVLSLAQQLSLERAMASLRAALTVRALDDKLRESQRLESVGRLAGGIAHDFNNLLMVIKSYTELARQGLDRDQGSLRARLGAIDHAADRAADLIRQLLAFGRRQLINPEVVRVKELIVGLEPMLSRLIGDDVELVLELDDDGGFTRVDPSLLEQVIVNLVVNGRDAMPRGGRLVIRTRRAPSSDGGQVDPGAGARIEISVSDSGTGIDPAILDRIFEPYFTTKDMEKGTGLGLATVYGIVEQSGGSITVESELGRGTTFTVRLPQVEATTTCRVGAQPRTGRAVAGETVLITEDEATIREALAEYLESQGLTVLQAVDGVDALEVAARHGGRLDLLVTDLVMPRMNGPDLATRLRSDRNGLKVIYVSGYTPETMRSYGVSGDDAVFLQKPFTLSDLSATIREVLDA
jgi:signal transduction histidine kinase/CheY-like chemotaxis protein